MTKQPCTARRFRLPRYARVANRCRNVCIVNPAGINRLMVDTHPFGDVAVDLMRAKSQSFWPWVSLSVKAAAIGSRARISNAAAARGKKSVGRKGGTPAPTTIGWSPT